MKKNEFYTVTIEDLTHEGLGVGKVDGFPLFIENSIPGEVVRVKTMKIGKSYGYARVEEWLEVSPNRVDVKDALGTRVGTMPLQHMTYESQLAFKQQQVKNVMTKIAKMPELEVRPTLGMESAFGYSDSCWSSLFISTKRRYNRRDKLWRNRNEEKRILYSDD